MEFPSPCGDKLQCTRNHSWSHTLGFRPLAGINCNVLPLSDDEVRKVSVPLRG